MASNACTIIASLWCRKFLKKNITISGCKHGRFDDVTNSYKQTIQTGNMLYNSFNLPAHQPSLEVCDVANKIPDLTLKILNDVGFFDVEHQKQAFIKMLQDGRHAGVLIIPPANSVAVLIENHQIALFDSHQHGNKGSLVLLCNLQEFESMYMLNYLGSQNLCGSNFAELGLTK